MNHPVKEEDARRQSTVQPASVNVVLRETGAKHVSNLVLFIIMHKELPFTVISNVWNNVQEETSNRNRVVYSNTHALRYAQFFMLYIYKWLVLFFFKNWNYHY